MGDVLGQVVSVNVGLARTVEWYGRQVTSAIWKLPVEGPIDVDDERLSGDESADLRVHGGVDKAVYAYATEDYDWWAALMPDTAFAPGLFGENLTISGVRLADAVIGSRWQVGSVVLEVSQPRFPCHKLGMRMGDAAFADRFDEARRNGAYFRIIEPGRLRAGDDVVQLSVPDHGVRIADLIAAKHDAPADVLHRILAVPTVPPNMHKLATRTLTTLHPKAP